MVGLPKYSKIIFNDRVILDIFVLLKSLKRCKILEQPKIWASPNKRKTIFYHPKVLLSDNQTTSKNLKRDFLN